jgi:ATP-dependent DNA helicase RecG
LRGFKDEHYKKLILQCIDRFGSASRTDIDGLIYDQLPGILSENQKYNKIHNLLYAMSKKDKSIKNEGTNRYPKWVRNV